MIVLAGATPEYFTQVAAVIVAGAVIAYAGARLGLVPIVGFLLAGVVIGPNGLGIVNDQEMVDAAAEVGVVLLLFTIGVEFSFEKLARIRRLILGGGTMQVVLAAGVTAGVLTAFGVAWQAALFTGFLVALSSTAIVLKLLGDRGETSSEHGQVSLGLLIFQDLAIIPMVLLVPLLGGQGGSIGDVGIALGKAALLIAAVLLVARRVMPPLLEVVARTCAPELFLLTIIAVCFGTAYLTSLAGVSLSLGAFLAGLVVSESRFSEHALGEILPLQIIFSAVFFVSVGMLLDLGFLVTHLPLVIGAALAVLAVKVATSAASVRMLGYRAPVAMGSGLLLAQIGEFSFVLERAGREVGLTPGGLGESGSQTFIATTVLLMVATPYLATFGARLERKLERHAAQVQTAQMGQDESADHLPQLENHVVVAGYGQAARRLVRVLKASGVPFVITTLNPEGAREAEAEGYPVLRGDSTRQRTLSLVSIERAKVMVVADDDPAAAARIATVGRMANPTMQVIVRTRYLAEVDTLTEAGADRVVAEELEAVVQLFASVLREYRVPPAEIEAHEAAVRRGGYAALREDEPDARELACSLEGDRVQTRTVTVRDGAPAAGRPIVDLPLEQFGIRLRGVRDGGGDWTDAPPADLVLRPGMELQLAGTAEAFERSAPAFRPAGGALPVAPPSARPVGTQVDPERLVTFVPGEGSRCTHLAQVRPVHPSARGCEECLRTGDRWVHLRICMTCGHVGCCDSSPNRHARAHFHSTEHPVMRSLEPGEEWGWCYADEEEL